MAEQSSIEWCDATFNPWIGCTKVSPACDHCYAERDFDLRRHVVQWGAGQARKRTAPANWKLPERWNKQAFCECPACGWRGEMRDAMRVIGLLEIAEAWCPACRIEVVQPARRRVFCASLADVFDNEVSVEWLVDLLDLIRSTPNLDWLLLTKRIGNWQTRIEAVIREIDGDEPCELRSWLWSWINDSPPRNVCLGATICNQAEADRDIPKLLATPAAVRFVSIEPMLGPIDLHSVIGGTQWIGGQRGCTGMHHGDGSRECPSELHHHHDERCGRGLDWVICGGESGPKARPMHPDWARSLRDQCAAAGVPFLFKQWGEHLPEYDRDRDDPDWCRCTDWSVKPGRWINLEGGQGFHGERVHYAHRVGKKAAGRLLDGVEHNGFPRAAT